MQSFAQSAAAIGRCGIGRFSVYDAAISATHTCAECSERAMTTATPGSKSAEDCLCMSGKYDSHFVGIIYGHPSNHGDHGSR